MIMIIIRRNDDDDYYYCKKAFIQGFLEWLWFFLSL